MQKYWAVNGDFIKQVGEDNSMRIFNGVKAESEGLSGGDLLKRSQPAFRTTKNNSTEESVLGKWAKENRNTKREYAMSLFSKFIEAEDGVGYFEVFIEGSRAQGPEWKGPGHDAAVNPEKSIGLKSWRRYHTIHTHPNKGPRDFSNRRRDSTLDKMGIASGGDIQFALDDMNSNLYLVPPTGGTMGVFYPRRYLQSVTNRMAFDNKRYIWNYKLKGSGGDYWIEPHTDDGKRFIKSATSEKRF